MISKSQTTRLFCASAFLLGAQFWRPILQYLESENHGVSPETGVDMETVVQVCEYARAREKRFENCLFLCVLVALLVSLANAVVAVALFSVAATIIYFRKTYQERSKLLSRFEKNEFARLDPAKEFRVALKSAVKSALPAEEQNLIVYTGFDPFVGAGIDMGGWSFTVDTSKPPESHEGAVAPLPFRIEELYATITVKLLGLNLDGLVVKDIFFVNGREIKTDREILPDIYGRPIQRLPSHRVSQYVNGSDNRIRYYKWIRVHNWEQELVMSYFLRLSIQGKNLYVENKRFLLTPIQEKYRSIDKLARLDAIGTGRILLTAMLMGPVKAAFTPFLMYSRCDEWLTKLWNKWRRRKTIKENTQFDYGAGQGYRQALSSGQYTHYFQTADSAFYTQVLEKSVLDNIVTFLEKHHIDTGDLRERQTVIMNSGIVVQGGNVNAESLAVGSGAVAMKSHAMTPRSRPIANLKFRRS